MGETKNTNTTEQQKQALKITVEPGNHESFNPISDTKYLTSVEFCEIVSTMFRDIFADWEGCKMVPLQGANVLQMIFFFNHNEHVITNSDLYRACTRDENSETKNATLASLRHRDHLLASGDAYHLTDDGMSSLRDFLYDNNNLYKRNGEVDWKKVVAEASDYTTTQGYGQPVAQQLTQVSWIDPIKLATLIFGENDSEDTVDNWVYNIRVMRSMPSANYSYGMYVGNNQPQNYLLAIDRISGEETKKLAALYGLVIGNGLGIIR